MRQRTVLEGLGMGAPYHGLFPGRGALDESPMAYKNSTEIKRVIGDTVEIADHWKEVTAWAEGGRR
jgi:hypothetical protein